MLLLKGKAYVIFEDAGSQTYGFPDEHIRSFLECRCLLVSLVKGENQKLRGDLFLSNFSGLVQFRWIGATELMDKLERGGSGEYKSPVPEETISSFRRTQSFSVV